MLSSSSYPVVVVGGGPGGIMAAMACASCGVKTLLVEQGAFLGGTATRSVIGPISPFHYQDEQIIRGFPQRLIDRMVSLGGATGHLKCINPRGTGSYICLYDHETYKYAAQEMLLEAGVEILFHACVQQVIKSGGAVVGVVLGSRFGSMPIQSQIVIDATGDGDVAVLAGEEYSIGNAEGKMQPASLMFEMANVDTQALYDYILKNPQQFTRRSDLVNVHGGHDQNGLSYFVAQGYVSLVRQAVENGTLRFGRDNIHTITGFHPGWVHFNSVRLSGYNTLDLWERSAAEKDGRRQMESIAAFMKKKVPGFEHAFIARAGCEIGIRETRHIQGMYQLTADDVISGKKFEDAISRGGFAIDSHLEKPMAGSAGVGGIWRDLNDCYDIPYRCLIPLRTDGLLLAGRSISGDAEAHASFRTQGVLMGYSQAAGIAAALCIQENCQPRKMKAERIQRQLMHFDASPFRDETRRAEEKKKADEAVLQFLRSHPDNITEGKYLQPYLDMMKAATETK